MKFKNIKTFTVSMGCFEFNVNVAIGGYKQAVKYVCWKLDRDIKDENYNYIPRGKCFFSQGYCPVIWIPRYPKTSREYATLAHECLHATMHLIEWACMPLSRDTEEVVCHCMAHLVNEILKRSMGR